MTFPNDSLQSIIDPPDWWVTDNSPKICRGALVFAFVPHVDQVPYTFEPIGRTDPEEHARAEVIVAPLKVDQPLQRSALPVAAMMKQENEIWTAYRAKKRPCLVVGTEPAGVEHNLTLGMPKCSTAPTVLVAPYYGADQNNRRAGYNAEFVERVRHCEYAQFVWDKLPIPGGPSESILRLDHIQPIGTHYHSYKKTEHRLSEAAMGIMDEIIQWLVFGGVAEDSLIALYRQEIEETFTT